MTTITFYSTGAGKTNVDVYVSDDDIVQLFEDSFAGYCPVCYNAEIYKGQVICCACLDEANEYHHTHCCIPVDTE